VVTKKTGKRRRKAIVAKDVERRRAKGIYFNLVLLVSLIVTIFLTSMFGSVGPIGYNTPSNIDKMPPQAVFDILIGQGARWDQTYSVIVLEVRLPRIVMAAFVGCALGVAGAIMQALFRNPMADPYVLGLSSGAALGASATLVVPVTVFTVVGAGVVIQFSSTEVLLPFLTFAGSLGTIFLVYNIARTGGKVNTDTLLLSGIAVSAFLGSIVMFLLFVKEKQFGSLFFWMLGGFSGINWEKVAVIAPVVLVCVIVTAFYRKDLNLLLTGEDTAKHLGMDVEKVKQTLLVLASLLTGISVAFAGIIGFVGLIVPHIVRLRVGPDHRYLILASALAGAIFLVWVDTIARTILGQSELPVGIITAMSGGPFFLYLLRTSRRSGRWMFGG
jgi:iron complex transport system permease protein